MFNWDMEGLRVMVATMLCKTAFQNHDAKAMHHSSMGQIPAIVNASPYRDLHPFRVPSSSLTGPRCPAWLL